MSTIIGSIILALFAFYVIWIINCMICMITVQNKCDQLKNQAIYHNGRLDWNHWYWAHGSVDHVFDWYSPFRLKSWLGFRWYFFKFKKPDWAE